MSKLVNNLNEESHLKTIAQLSCEAEEIIFVSPFIYNDFDRFFEQLEFKYLRSIQLITTLQPKGNDQLKKPDALFSFIKLLKDTAPSATCRIHFNNKLHGKIYLFEYKPSMSKALVTSANLTDSGLNRNNEWGILIDDQLLIKQLKKEIVDTIEYADVSHELITGKMRYLADHARQNSKEIVGESNVDISLIQLLQKFAIRKNENKPLSINDIKTTNNIKTTNDTKRLFLKPYGYKEKPVLLSGKKRFGHHHPFDFPKRSKPNEAAPGDIFITFGTGSRAILCIQTALTGLEEKPKDLQAIDEDAKRWPWSINGYNHTPQFGNEWWEHNITIDQLEKEYMKENPHGSIGVKKSKKRALGTFNFGAGYLEISQGFAEFIINKIMRVEEKLTD